MAAGLTTPWMGKRLAPEAEARRVLKISVQANRRGYTPQMTEFKPDDYIRTERSEDNSVDEQVRFAHFLYGEGVIEGEDEKKQSEVADLVEKSDKFSPRYSIKTLLGNLRETVVVGREQPDGADYVVISERKDDIISGKWEENVKQDTENLIDHIQDEHPLPEGEDTAAADGGLPTVRTVVADAIGASPSQVEHELRSGLPKDQNDRLNDAVDAINETTGVSQRKSYGRIVTKRVAYRYFITRKAVERFTSGPDNA